MPRRNSRACPDLAGESRGGLPPLAGVWGNPQNDTLRVGWRLKSEEFFTPPGDQAHRASRFQREGPEGRVEGAFPGLSASESKESIEIVA